MSNKQYCHNETKNEICLQLVLKELETAPEDKKGEFDPEGTGEALLQSLLETCQAKGKDCIYEIHGDGTGLIRIGGKAWAAEDPHPLRGVSGTLPRSVWELCYLASHTYYRKETFGDLDNFLCDPED